MGPRAGLDGYGKYCPTAIPSPDSPAHSESLHRLSHRGPLGVLTCGSNQTEQETKNLHAQDTTALQLEYSGLWCYSSDLPLRKHPKAQKYSLESTTVPDVSWRHTPHHAHPWEHQTSTNAKYRPHTTHTPGNSKPRLMQNIDHTPRTSLGTPNLD